MKAVLFHDLPEDGSLSMQRYGRELAAALADLDNGLWHFDHVVGSGGVGAQVPGPMPTGRPHTVKLTARLRSAFARYAKYPFRAARTAGDVYHVLDHGYSQLCLGLSPWKTVVTCHDIIPLLASAGAIPMHVPRTVARTFRFRLACMSRAALIIAISESTKRNLVQHAGIPANRIVVVYYGVSSVFQPNEDVLRREATRRSVGLPVAARVILHIGTSGRYKNTPVLLRALARVREAGDKDTYLLRIGSDFYPDEKRLIAELGLSANIVHAGAVRSDQLLAEFYRAADVFVFPSMWEGFGWPVLEAMACSTPVVTSNAASLPEVVGDTGLMVDAHDIGALSGAIRAVLNHPELGRSLGEKGRRRSQQFTWQRTAEATMRVYEEVAGHRRRAD